jgi:ABC-2 type transport system permease protein
MSAAAPMPPAAPSRLRIFMALLHRDLRVTRREWVPFLIRSGLQPLLLVTVFGYLLPKMGAVAGGFALTLLPGVLSVTLTLSSLQSVALPMVTDFGFTKEIEDRLLAPIPTALVAGEKLVSGVVQGVVATSLILPVAVAMMGASEVLTAPRLLGFLAVSTVASLVFSSFGLWLGTAIPPQHIALMFGVIFAPMIFFGCAYYSWQGLAAVPILKWAVLINPMVYVSEGMRAALTPDHPHMAIAAIVAALGTLAIAFTLMGLKSFQRKAID